MTTRSHHAIARAQVEPHKSVTVSAAGLVFVSGLVADHARGDIAEQTREVLTKLDGLLAQAGSSRDGLLSATIWLADIAEREAMNRVWVDWLPAHSAPARACVGAALADPAYRVEIAAIALQSVVRA